MAITNVGYDGTVSDVEFAQLSQHTGAIVPVVCGRTDFAVTVNTGGTLTCNVAAGSAEAPGVLTKSDTTASVSFDAVSTAGQTRWDAVVLRRNWSTGISTLVVVKGTAATSAPQVLPSGVDLVLDSAVDQVLALVQITNGQPLPTQVVDRRVWGSKFFTVPSSAALPTPTAALYGMIAETPGGERYHCLADGGGNPAWSRIGPTVATSGFATAGTGFTIASLSNRYTVSADGTEVQYDIQARRSGASIQASSTGDMLDTTVMTVSGIKPDQSVPVTFNGVGGATAAAVGAIPIFGYMNTAGAIVLASGLPNLWLSQRASGVSLSACIKFTKGV